MKAQANLGWRHKTKFDTLVADMVEADMVAVVEEAETSQPPGLKVAGRFVRCRIGTCGGALPRSTCQCDNINSGP